MPPLTVPDFVARWQPVTLSERGAAQPHFIDLCDLLGQPRPTDVDQSGTFYTFEKGVSKNAGGDGFADVWFRDHFAWEYKGKHKNLGAAYQQLLQYREDLDNPPLLVVCDLNRFEVHTNFTGTAKRVYAFTLADLANPAPTATTYALSALEVLRALFAEPERLKPQRTTEQVTATAAAEFATLADSLRANGQDPEEAAHFLMRLLFCLFAEDIALLPAGLFTNLVRKNRGRPAVFDKLLADLFDKMASGGFFGGEEIAHFDGGLFADSQVLPLSSPDLAVLGRACGVDWASVEPAIFGTLFERSLDPNKRSQTGAHYTSRADIMLVVEPVLLAPLRREWAEVRRQAEALAAKRDAAKGTARTRQDKALARLLTGFTDRIAGVRVLDPACGSGNFLYVALKQLLDLEKEVITFAANHGLTRFMPKVGPRQLHGLEINPYAHQLASIVVWIGYIQWLHDNGFEWQARPVLEPLDNIQERDAILAYNADGKPVGPEWPGADVIIGNPPFLGGNRIRQGLGDRYVEDLFSLYQGRVPAFSDLVCYWFERARALIEEGKVRRAGLLATQAIRGGANRRILERIKDTGDIFLAWADRPWILDGAAVHVSIIGFDDGSEKERTLDGTTAPSINPDLTSAIDMTHAFLLQENALVSFQGPSPKGPFDIGAEVARSMLAAPVNVNGRPNSDVVRPVASAVDLVQRARGCWTIDFGMMSLEVAAQYEQPFEYVRKHVYPVRSKNRRAAYARKWWQYAEARPGMRQALNGRTRFIATPCHSKHRMFTWLPASVLANGATIVFARDDDYFFGLLHSRLHELWALRLGTALEDRPRYTPTTTFETFPFPWPPGKEPADDRRVQAIAAAAREMVVLRDAWLNPPDATEAELKKRTLTNLYNQRPGWLDLAHRRLDEAVLDAYGWPHDLPDDEILSRLLALNLERAPVASADTVSSVAKPAQAAREETG